MRKCYKTPKDALKNHQFPTAMKVAHICLLLVMVNFLKVEGFLLFHSKPKVDLEATEPNTKRTTAEAMTSTTTLPIEPLKTLDKEARHHIWMQLLRMKIILRLHKNHLPKSTHKTKGNARHKSHKSQIRVYS